MAYLFYDAGGCAINSFNRIINLRRQNVEPEITKAQLLNELQQENVQFEALLAAIGPARMMQSDVAGGWSIKDIVAHLTGWRWRTVARFRAARSGGPVTPSPWPPELKTDDEINAWIYAANRDRS